MGAKKERTAGIKITTQQYRELQNLKIVPEEPFHKVIGRILKAYHPTNNGV